MVGAHVPLLKSGVRESISPLFGSELERRLDNSRNFGRLMVVLFGLRIAHSVSASLPIQSRLLAEID